MTPLTALTAPTGTAAGPPPSGCAALALPWIDRHRARCGPDRLRAAGAGQRLTHAVGGISGAYGCGQRYYTIEVPAGARTLSISIAAVPATPTCMCGVAPSRRCRPGITALPRRLERSGLGPVHRRPAPGM